MSEQSLFSRRAILLSSWPLLVAPAGAAGAALQQQGSSTPTPSSTGAIGESFPMQDQELVKEMVTVAHGRVARVKELVGRQQTLAKATYDWGFGDWESALGAASHVGNREIAEFLLANGARPTLFSAAMLGQLDVVKAFVAASPGVQRIKGPHSITLLRHAMAGGELAKPVLEYLTQLGGADDRPTEKSLTEEERTSLVGLYPFGSAAADRMEISISRDTLQIARPGHAARGLTHLGGFEFCPVGAENVRIRFERSAANVTMAIYDPDVVLKARRVAGA
jgi:hypothetical protein